MENLHFFAVYFQIAIFGIFIWYAWLKCGGIKKTVSAQVYCFKNDASKAWDQQWIFRGALFLFSFPVVFNMPNFCGFLAFGGIAVAAVAADFRSNIKSVSRVHNWGSYTGIIFGLLGVWYTWQKPINFIYALLFVVIALVFWLRGVKNRVYFLEIIAFFLVCIGMLVNMGAIYDSLQQ